MSLSLGLGFFQFLVQVRVTLGYVVWMYHISSVRCTPTRTRTLISHSTYQNRAPEMQRLNSPQFQKDAHEASKIGEGSFRRYACQGPRLSRAFLHESKKIQEHEIGLGINHVYVLPRVSSEQSAVCDIDGVKQLSLIWDYLCLIETLALLRYVSYCVSRAMHSSSYWQIM